LASGYSDLDEFEKAIPHFRKIADLSVYSNFTRGLIYALYQSGELEQALELTENLFSSHPDTPFLAEIIGNIYTETKKVEKALEVTVAFQQKAKGKDKDYFSYRAAKMYSHTKDWENVRKMALQVQELKPIPLNDIFTLAYLLVKAGEKDKGMQIGYEARIRFFDKSEAHLKYISLLNSSKDKHEDLFPDKVAIDCAVIIRNENGKEHTYLITEKQSKGENILKPTDEFAKKLIGKFKNDELTINKGYGITDKIQIAGIMTIFVHAFHESLRLFETRFAGMHGIGVFKANPGQPGDQVEQVVKDTTINGNEFHRQVLNIYNRRIAPIGVIASLYKRNIVKQWMALVTSPDTCVYAYSHNELPQLEKTMLEKRPVVLDITSLLTNFYLLPENILFTFSNKQIYVTRSTIEELQEHHDELEAYMEEGMLSLGFQDGDLVVHKMTSEDVAKQRQKIMDIINWCNKNATIIVPSGLIKIKRKDRQRTSELLGDCFYDSILLAKELGATVVSDDDIFKNLLRSEHGIISFSTFQLAIWEAQHERLSNESFEKLVLQTVLANYIFIPINAEVLWKTFDHAGFQLRKPFTTAVKGLNILVPGMLCAVISVFTKKLFLESGLTLTREQTLLCIFGEIAKRPDFGELKKMLITFLREDLKFMPTVLDNTLQLVNSF
jgi:transcription elongation GreA/GreB family factor